MAARCVPPCCSARSAAALISHAAHRLCNSSSQSRSRSRIPLGSFSMFEPLRSCGRRDLRSRARFVGVFVFKESNSPFQVRLHCPPWSRAVRRARCPAKPQKRKAHEKRTFANAAKLYERTLEHKLGSRVASPCDFQIFFTGDFHPTAEWAINSLRGMSEM